MNEREWLYAGLMLFGVLISSVSQVLLKKAANRTYSSVLKEYLNPTVIFAYSVFFLATFCSVFAYRGIPLSMGPVLESASYLFVTIFGYFFFQEKISRRKIIALILIIGGILVYTFC